MDARGARADRSAADASTAALTKTAQQMTGIVELIDDIAAAQQYLAARILAGATAEASKAAGAEIEKVAGLFGVVFWPEEGAITHSSATAVIGADGRLRAVVDGSSYRASQLLDVIENALR